MRLVVLKENFKKGLGYVERITGKNLSLPILENVLISAEQNFLHLTSTNLETAISWWGFAKTEKEGKIAVPVKFLSTLTSFFSKEPITLKVENTTLHIESGSFRNQIKGFSPDEFPIIPLIENQVFTLENASFIEGLSQVVEVATTTFTRPEISGVYFSTEGNFIKLVATDSFRLAEKTLPIKKRVENDISFILPARTVYELINSFDDKKGQLFVYFSPSQVMFELPMEETPHPELQSTSKLIEGEYPNYQDIIPKKHDSQFTVSRNDFLGQDKAAGLFSGKTNEVKLNVIPEKNRVEVFSQSAESGQSNSSLPAKIQGKKLEISFNWRFLAGGLSHIKSAEVTFGLTKEEGPAVLKPVEDLSYLYVVMPVKAS